MATPANFWRSIALVLLLAGGVSSSLLHAASTGPCGLISRTCVEPQETRVIGGFSIFKECWRYESEYECQEDDNVDDCSDLNVQQCQQASSSCSETSEVDGTCKTYSQIYSCTEPAAFIYTNFDEQTDTVTKEEWETSQCDLLANNTSCTFGTETCTSANQTRKIGYADITRSCWQKTNVYSCTVDGSQSDCQQFVDQGCALIDSDCYSYDAQGNCNAEEHTYECATPGEETTEMDCEGQTFCLQGNCFDNSYSNDEDFLNSVTIMEMARQGGVYFVGAEIFAGEDKTCKKALSV